MGHCAFLLIEKYHTGVLMISCQKELSYLLSIRYGSTAERKEFNRRINQIKNIPRLILDDLGKEKKTAACSELLYEIIDHRARERKAIWITTNFSGDELIEHHGDNYGKAILRRLESMIPAKNRLEIK